MESGVWNRGMRSLGRVVRKRLMYRREGVGDF